MLADFYEALMVERCWREFETSHYAVAPLDEAGLHAAIVTPAMRAGVHVDAALVERLIREIDRERPSRLGAQIRDALFSGDRKRRRYGGGAGYIEKP